MTDDERQSALAKTWMLRERFDHDANRQLVELIELPDDRVAHEAARQLEARDLPPELGERAAAMLTGACPQVRLVIAERPRPAQLAGLPILPFGSRFAPWRHLCDVETDRDIVHAREFGDAHVEALAAIADRFGWPPATAVLTENSD